MSADNVIEYSITAKDNSSKALSSFKNSLTSINTLMGVGTIVAFASAIKSSIDFASRIKDTSLQLGFSTTALQQWRFVAEQSGGSIQAMDTGLIMFNRALGEAASGNTTFQKTLDRVGITLADIQTRSPEEIFERVRDSVSKMDNVTEKAQITFQLFGRGGKDLAGVFLETADGANKLKQQASEMGAVMKEAAINRAKEAGDKLSALGNVMKVQMSEALIELIPLITQVSDLLVKLAPAGKYVAFIFNRLSQGFQELNVSIAGYAAAATEAAQLNFSGAREILKMMKVDISEIQKQGEAARAAMLSGDAGGQESSDASPATGAGDPSFAGSASIQKKREEQEKWLAELESFREQDLISLSEQLQAEEDLRKELGNRLREGTGQAHLVRQEELAEEVELMAETLGMTEELQRYHSEQLIQIEADRLNEIDFLEMQSAENRIRISQNLTDRQANIVKASVKFKQASEKQQVAFAADAMQQTLSDLGTFNKSAFEAWKAFSIAKAVINTYLAASTALSSYSPPISFIMAALQIAAGLAQVSKIRSQSYSGQAHAGLQNVPSEGTFLLDKGERVLAPAQNQDLTNFLSQEGGGKSGTVSVDQLIINIDIPDSNALLNMDRNDWRDIVAKNIIPALDALDRIGVRPVAIERRQGS